MTKLSGLVRSAATTVLALGVFASYAHAEPGFIDPSDVSPESRAAKLPAEVRESSRSVLRGFVVSGAPMMVLEPTQYAGMVDFFENVKIESADPIRRSWGKIQALLIKSCIANQLSQCKTGYPHFGMGSFFLVEDKKTLVTARHVIERALPKLDGADESYCAAYKLNPPMILLDSTGTLLFDSINGTDTASIKTLGDENTIQASTQSATLAALGSPMARLIDNSLNDVAIIGLEKDISMKPLTWALESDSNQTFYAVGYPQITTGRKVLGVEDSNGTSLFITVGGLAAKNMPSTIKIGQLLNDQAGMQRFSEYLDEFDNWIVRTTNDGVHGMSGGPLLNEQGRVRGVVFAAHSQQMETFPTEQLWAVSSDAVSAVRDTVAANLDSVCAKFAQ
jgi:hypothetical protein